LTDEVGFERVLKFGAYPLLRSTLKAQLLQFSCAEYKCSNGFQRLPGNNIVPGDMSQINTELKEHL